MSNKTKKGNWQKSIHRKVTLVCKSKKVGLGKEKEQDCCLDAKDNLPKSQSLAHH